MLFNRSDFVRLDPPFQKTWLSYAQSRAFHRLDNPVGHPFGGAAYGQYESSGFWSGVGETFNQGAKEISNAFAAIDKNVIQPIGNALESIGQAIANDPITFIAQVAAVALAPTTGGASLWALPLIQGASVAAHGGSFEDVLKASAISAATVWAGGQVSQFVMNGVTTAIPIAPGIEQLTFSVAGVGMEYTTATALSNAIGYSVASGLGAAAQGKNIDQIASIALASGVGAALPAVVGAVPGFNELVSGASGINETLGKAIQNGIVNTAGAVLSSAITKTDMGEAVVAGLIQSGINSIVTTKNIVTDAFKSIGDMTGFNSLSGQAQGIIANTMTSVFGAALNGGNAGTALSKAFMNAGIQAIGSIDGKKLTEVGNRLTAIYNSAKELSNGYTSSVEEFDATAQKRDELFAESQEWYDNLEVSREEFVSTENEYDAFVERYNDSVEVAKSTYNRLNVLQQNANDAKRNYESTVAVAEQNRQKAQEAANAANSASENAAFNYRFLKTAADQVTAIANNPLEERSNWQNNYDNAVANYNDYKKMYELFVAEQQKYVDQYNTYKASYEDGLSKANEYLNTYNSASDEYKSTADVYKGHVTQAEAAKSGVESVSKELQALSKKIEADLKYYQDHYVAGVKSIDEELSAIDKDIAEYANEYFKKSDELQKVATEFTQEDNAIKASINKSLTMALDPKFNEEEYKNINNLGPAVDAYTHWATVGKNEGLYTNYESAAVELDQQYTRLMWDMSAKTGRSLLSYSPAEVADLKDKLYSQYGNRLNALQTATADTVLSESNMSIGQYLSTTSQEYTPAPDWFKNAKWNAPVGYTPPDGTKLANHEDVLTGRAYESFTDSGETVWLTSGDIPKDSYKYDAASGTMIRNVVVIGDSGANLDDDGTIEIKSLPATNIEEVDPYEAVQFFGSMDASIVANLPEAIGNLNREGIKAMADGSKILLDYAKSTGSDTFYTVIQRGLDIGATGLAGVAQIVSATASVASLIMGTNPNDSALQSVANGLKDWSNATSSAEFKYATAKMDAAMKSAEGGDVAAAIINNAKEFPVDFALKYIGTNLVSFLPGVGLGFAAAKGATAAAKLAGFADDAIVKLAAGTGLTTQRAYEMAQEAGSAGLQAFNETRNALKNQNPTWSDTKLDDEAMNRAQIVAGTAALATLATQAVGLDKIAQNIFLGGGSSNSVLAPMINKLVSTLSETVGEAWQSFVPQAMQNILMLEIDPSTDAKKALIQETFLGAIGGFGQAGAINTLSAVQDLPAMYLVANQAFENQIKSGNYTMGELGTVLNQWVPKDTALSTDVRNQVVPTIFEKYPQFALPYKDASSFLNAVKNDLGVWEVTAVDAVDTKFDNDVVTRAEAVQLLESKGLTNATFEDVAKANIMGLLSNDTATKALTYANQNMVYAEDLRAAAAKENYAATQQELDALVGRGVKAEVIQQFIQQADPKATTAEEATKFFKDAGYSNATAAEIAQFVKSSSESDMQKAVVTYVDPHQVTRQEAVDYFKSINYTPTDAEVNQFITQGADVVQANIYKNIAQFVDPRYTTVAEVQAAAAKQGYTMSAEEAAQFAGQYNQVSKEADAEAYADKLAVLADEARQYFSAEGYTPTAEDVAKYTGVRNEADTAKLIAAYADPLVMTESEARGYMSELGYTQPTPTEVAQFVKQASESGTKDALSQYVGSHQVTRSEALDFFAKIGYSPTEAEIANYVKQGAGISQADVQAALGAYVDPRFVDAEEVRAAFKSLGLDAPISSSDIARYTGQYAETDLTAKATAALPVVAANAMFALQRGDTGVTSGVVDAIIQKMEDYQSLNMTRAEAQDAAIQAIAAQLGTTKGSLETFVTNSLKDYATKTDIQDAIAGIEFPAGISQNDVYKAISDYMKANPGITLDQVAGKVADITKNLPTTADVNTAISSALKDYATKLDIENAIDSIQFPPNLSKGDVLAAIKEYMDANPGITLEQVAGKIGDATKDLATSKDVESTISNALKGYATQQNVDAATKTLQDALQIAQSGNTSRFNDIDAAIKSLKDAGLTTTQVQKIVNDSATGLSSEFKTALSNAAKGNTDALNAVKSSLEGKISDVQTAIDKAISGQSDAFGAKVKELMDQGSTFQEATEKALSNLGVSISSLGENFSGQLADVQSSIKDAIKGQSDVFGAKVKELMDQGATFQEATNAAITQVGANVDALGTKFGSDLSAVQTALEDKLGTQQAAFDEKVKSLMDQGANFQDATKSALSSLGVNIADLGADFNSKLDSVQTNLSSALNDQSAAFNAKIQDLISKGVDYQTATEKALSDVGIKIDDLGVDFSDKLANVQNSMTTAMENQSVAFNNRVQELMDQGKTYQQATNQALGDLGIRLNDLGTSVSSQYNNLTKQVSGLSTELNATELRLTEMIAQNEAAGMARSAATQKAIGDLATQLGTTAVDINSKIDSASQSFNLAIQTTKTDIANTKADLVSLITANESAGMSRDAATQKAIGDLSAKFGVTEQSLLAQIGSTKDQLSTQIDSAIKASKQYTQEQITSATQEIKTQMLAYEQAGYDRDTATQLAISGVAQDLGIAKTDLIDRIGTTEANLTNLVQASAQAGQQYTQQQVQSATTQLQSQIEANLKAGMDANAATNKAVSDLSQQLGVASNTLMSQLGTSVSQLQAQIAASQQASQQFTQQQVSQATTLLQQQIAANQQAGMDANAATNKAVADVAAQLGTTTTNLQTQIATSNSQLAQQIQQAAQAGQAYTQQQVSQATKQIQDQMALYQQAGYDRDTALSLAISTVAQDLGTTRTDFLNQLGTTETNLRTEFSTGLSDVKNSILAKVAEYQQQGLSSDQALQAAIDTVSQQLGTTRSDLLGQIGTTETALRGEIATQVSSSEKRLADLVAEKEAQGMQRDQALQLSINQLAQEQNTTRTDLLNKIDLTSQQFQNQIEIAKTDLGKQLTVVGQQTQQQIAATKSEIQSQMAAYQSANMDADTALSLAIAGVAQDLGISKSDLLSKIGTSETNLRTEFTQQTTALSTQVQDVAKLLGKPASQVTANDVTMVQNMIAGTEATNLGYDVNRDGKVDTNDLTLIQQQQQIQQGTNVTQTIDPTTGLPVYTDTTTGKVITGFTPSGTSPWAASGIYSALDQQKAQAAATAKAQAAATKTASQKSQFGSLMGMLFQAPDALGQQVSVKTPDPAKINYIYDFSSIFANPSQASMMPSPYGPANTVAPKQPQQPQQAANQPLFQLASGFAGGGIVGSNDIQVGGNVDDLLEILKGN